MNGKKVKCVRNLHDEVLGPAVWTRNISFLKHCWLKYKRSRDAELGG